MDDDIGRRTSRPAADVVRVSTRSDLARDPPAHNLFPFEIAIAVFVGGVVSGAAVGCARLTRWVIGPPIATRPVVGGRARS